MIQVIGIEEFEFLLEDYFTLTINLFPLTLHSFNSFNSYVLDNYLTKILDCNREIHQAVKKSVFSLKKLKETEQRINSLEEEIQKDCDEYLKTKRLPTNTKEFIFKCFKEINSAILFCHQNEDKELTKMDFLVKSLETEFRNLDSNVEEYKRVFSWDSVFPSQDNLQICLNEIQNKYSSMKIQLENVKRKEGYEKIIKSYEESKEKAKKYIKIGSLCIKINDNYGGPRSDLTFSQ